MSEFQFSISNLTEWIEFDECGFAFLIQMKIESQWNANGLQLAIEYVGLSCLS